MPSTLDKKKAKRNGLRSYVSGILGNLRNVLDDESTPRHRFAGLKANLEKAIQDLSNVDEQIINVLESEDVEVDVYESMKFLEEPQFVLAELDEKLKNLSVIDVDKASSLTSHHSSSSFSNNCKLPKLELLLFSGDPLSWQGFWDQFQISVHSNENISDIDRFNYLKRYLKDGALSAVSGLSLCSENYSEAIRILKERYGNEQILISAHMASLLGISKIKRSDDIKGLRKLYDDVENCMRNLTILKQDSKGYGSLLIPLLKDRLPDDLIMTISRQFGSEVWSLETLMKHFHSELRALENALPASRKPDGQKISNKPDGFTAANLLANDGSRSRRACVYCCKIHPSSR